ncbi:MAG: LPS-assembly protein LptD [bacterium]|nr:LPS-assembly protein LptD [bacterium]
MIRATSRAVAIAVAATLAVTANAQSTAGTKADSQSQSQAKQAPARAGTRFSIDAPFGDFRQTGDFDEQRLFGGTVMKIPDYGIEVRGLNAIVLFDTEVRTLLEQPSNSGLPRRRIEPPAPRRRLSPAEIRKRVERSMSTFGKGGKLPESEAANKALDAVRFLYFEGGIYVIRGDEVVLRCDRLWISPLEDRLVVENVELRYTSTTSQGVVTVVVRGPKLTKNGMRWTGRDLTITTSKAAEPNVAFAAGEAEIIERENELEIFGRGLALQFSGVNAVPLPDAHFFTGSQTQFPIKRAGATYSQREGIQTEVVLGLPWNSTGGALHHWLTGRPAEEFRGEWELGIGWWETRGVPLSPALTYSAPGLYDGRTQAFWLDDRGPDIREIQANIDGSPIGSGNRALIRSQNRFYLGDDTEFDFQAFTATDPAVLSEFYGGEFRDDERPETSGYLKHFSGNHLVTFGARTNLDDFSYRSNRTLAPRFIEELPVLTWNWIAEPVAETPWETPIVLDVATELGQRRSAFDDRAGVRTSDRTFRADQEIEISAPFTFGAISLRPFVSSRGTYYDNTIAGDNEARIAFTAGIQAGTRLAREFHWVGNDGPRSIRHVIAPRLMIVDRFHVDDRIGELHQFDGTDALTESTLVRFEIRNLLQRTDQAPETRKPETPTDFLMLDLAQDFWPNASRDNGGDALGLFYYDLLYRPDTDATPFETITFAIYGDHDWQDGMRTLDTEISIGEIAGLTWTLEYRTDQAVDGAVGVSAMARAFGRWDLMASSLYDLQRDDWLTYNFGIRRHDPDWIIGLAAGYDPFTDQTSVRLEFVPTLPGVARQRGARFDNSRLHGPGFATRY